MKKSEVNICDVCRRIVTEKKCEICDKDICENCEDDMGVGLANGGVLFYIISCKSCSNKLEKSKLKKYFEDEPHTKIRKNLLKVFRNAIVVENLQENDERLADKKWMYNKIKDDDPHPVNNSFLDSMRKRNLPSIPSIPRKGPMNNYYTSKLKGGKFKKII